MVGKVKLSCQIVGYVVDTAHSVATRSNSFGLQKKKKNPGESLVLVC